MTKHDDSNDSDSLDDFDDDSIELEDDFDTPPSYLSEKQVLA